MAHLLLRALMRRHGRKEVGALRRSGILLTALAVTGLAAAPATADVGHRTETILVAGQEEGELREVDVHLWYPADPADAASRPKTVYKSTLWEEQLPNDWSR